MEVENAGDGRDEIRRDGYKKLFIHLMTTVIMVVLFTVLGIIQNVDDFGEVVNKMLVHNGEKLTTD